MPINTTSTVNFDIPDEPLNRRLARRIERVLSNGLNRAHSNVLALGDSTATPTDKSAAHQITKTTTEALMRLWVLYDDKEAMRLVLLAIQPNILARAKKIERVVQERIEATKAIGERVERDLQSYVDAARKDPSLLDRWPVIARVNSAIGYGAADHITARKAKQLADDKNEGTVSLSAPLDDENSDGQRLLNLLPDDAASLTFDVFEDVALARALLERTEFEDPEHRLAVELSIGLDDGQHEMNDSEIAEAMGLSNRLAAQRRKTKGLEALRKTAEKEGLL